MIYLILATSLITNLILIMLLISDYLRIGTSTGRTSKIDETKISSDERLVMKIEGIRSQINKIIDRQTNN